MGTYDAVKDFLSSFVAEYDKKFVKGIKTKDIDEKLAITEEEFFQNEMMISVNGVYAIAKIISDREKKRELPSEGDVAKLLHELELETIFTVEEFYDVLTDEFRFCTDNVMKMLSKKNIELFGIAIQHRVMLYSLNPFEENAKFIRAKHVSSIPDLEEGNVKRVGDCQKFFKKAVKSFPALKAITPNNELSSLETLIKMEFGAVVLVGVQGGVVTEEVFIDILHHLNLMMRNGKLTLVRRGQDEEGNDSDEGEAEEEYEEEKEVKSEKKKSRKKDEPFHLTGRSELNKYFNDNIIDVVKNEKLYEKFGIGFPEPFILEGPPGSGKTYAAERLAEYLDWKTYHINSSSVGSSLIHETAKRTEEMFKKAKRTAPSVVIIDEMDAFMPDRKRVRNADSHAIEEVSSFLRCLQRATDDKILVIGTTNFIENIDPAILRSGRMGKHLKVEMPNEDEITEVLELEVNKRPHGKINVRDYAKRLMNKPLSDVVSAVRNASMIAAKRRARQLSTEDMDKGIDELLESSKKEETKSIGFVS